MNTLFEHLKKEADQIRLSENEKRTMRVRLERGLEKTTPHTRLTPSPLLFFAMRLAPAALSVALVFGGTAYAAESALPGDVLYAVKINLNERVRETVAFSAEAKAQWYAQAAERRAEEAETLAARGSLSSQAEEHIAAALDAHVEKAELFASQVREEDEEKAERLEARLSFALEAHAAVLDRVLEQESGETHREGSDLSRRIAERSTRGSVSLGMKAAPAPEAASLMLAESASLAVDASLSARTAQEAPPEQDAVRAQGSADFSDEASEVLTRVEKRLASLRSQLSAEAFFKVEQQLHTLRESLEKHKGETSREILRQAITLEVFLKAQKRLERPLLPAPIETGERERAAEHGRDAAPGILEL